MQSITSLLDTAFRSAIKAAYGIDADPLIAPAQNDKFGDYQSNVAMSLAKQVQAKNPRAVAEQILAHLDVRAIGTTTIAGPGFINVKLSAGWIEQRLGEMNSNDRLGVDPVAQPQTVVIDYSGPNIAKEMHVGHLRSTIIGDSVARAIAFEGHNVIRQNHIGDWGTQFGRVVLAMWYLAVFERSGRSDVLNSVIRRQREAAAQLAATGDKATFGAAIDALVREIAPLHQQFLNHDPEGEIMFRDWLNSGALQLDSLEEAYVFVSVITDSAEAKIATIHHERHGAQTLSEIPRLTTTFIQDPAKSSNQQEKLAWEKAREVTLATCDALYRRLNVQLADPSVQSVPIERGESRYNDDLPGIVSALQQKGLAVVSEGAVVVNVPGFEHPLIIEKSSMREGATGGYLYGTTDLAAIRYRVQTLHADRVVYFVDARQSQHFQQVFWIAKQAGWAEGVNLQHAPFGTMLGPDGKPFKTRSGDTVKLKSLLDEAEERATDVVVAKNPDLPEAQKRAVAHAVGVGAVKYADLSKDRISDYVFSFDKMLSLDGNTAPYLQYAFARIRSIFRKAAEENAMAGAMSLTAPQELDLAKHLLRLSDVIASIGRDLKPHVLCTYLFELATKFSGFYESCPVLKSEPSVRSSRLALCEITAKVLERGLNLLGIECPQTM